MGPIQPSLFQPETAFPRESLRTAVRALAQRNVFIGTSSWRYEGWLGQFYTPERYFSRGRFSKKKFHEECIQEYAEVFPVVGGDFSFYAPQPPDFWVKLFAQAPRELKWSLKAPEDFTCKRFPQHPRYGPRRGLMNPVFLDARAFEAAFLDPLSPYFDRLAVVMFEFGTFSRETYPDPRAFFDDLGAFLETLPRTVAYGVEIRNPEFLEAGYFDVLRTNGVAHVFNSWTRMPSLREQLEIEDAFTAPFSVARALLRPGRVYEQAVASFSPYREIREEYPEGREALRSMIQKSMERARKAYIHINNRLEGNAIETIRAIAE
ncbi:MAG: DUF72 domain-containing protein [Acidobacteriia bacterium]|nr:DUF72 domain-containing protein [Terriglobia bacterium]